MSEHDGVIRAQMEVHCRDCERPYLGLGPTRAGAAKELLRNGWTKVANRWFCASCATEALNRQRAEIAFNNAVFTVARMPARPKP